jgi:hypothetical protein
MIGRRFQEHATIISNTVGVTLLFDDNDDVATNSLSQYYSTTNYAGVAAASQQGISGKLLNSNEVIKTAPKSAGNSSIASSSIGSIRRVRSSKFYWRSDTATGDELPIFSVPDAFHVYCSSSESSNEKTLPVFWPLSGISISADSSTEGASSTKLAVIGCLVCQSELGPNSKHRSSPPPKKDELREEELFGFEEKNVAVFVVDNPYDPADLWTYQAVALRSITTERVHKLYEYACLIIYSFSFEAHLLFI